MASMRFSRGLLIASMMSAVACTGAPAETAAPATAQVATPTPAPPTAAPVTAAPVTPKPVTPVPATPTAVPVTPEPPTPEPATAPPVTSEPTEPAVSPADLLISYAHENLRDTCAVSDQVYPTELASVTCGPEDLPFTFTLFGSLADMAAAYNHDLTLGDTPPEPDGACKDANFEGTYDIDDAPAGRLNCRSHTSSSTGEPYRVMEWTNDNLLVIGYLSNRADLHTWNQLFDFWSGQAGPFSPD